MFPNPTLFIFPCNAPIIHYFPDHFYNHYEILIGKKNLPDSSSKYLQERLLRIEKPTF